MFSDISPLTVTVVATFFSCVIGFITSFFFHRRQEKKKKISYSVLYNRLLDDRITDVIGHEFKWRDIAIEKPYFLRVFVWNSGNETIVFNDLSKNDPLHIHCSELSLIGARWMDVSSLTSTPRLDVKKEKSRVDLSFEFLEPNGGFVVDIVGNYTGEEKKHPIVYMSGSIKGAKVSSDFRPIGFLGKDYAVGAIGFAVLALLNAVGIVPLTGLFFGLSQNVYTVAATIIGITSIANIILWSLLCWICVPRAHFPNMIREHRRRLADIDRGEHHGKWRIVVNSLFAGQANLRATKDERKE